MAMQVVGAKKQLGPGRHERVAHVSKLGKWKSEGWSEAKDQSSIPAGSRYDSVLIEKIVPEPEKEKGSSKKEKTK